MAMPRYWFSLRFRLVVLLTWTLGFRVGGFKVPGLQGSSCGFTGLGVFKFRPSSCFELRGLGFEGPKP